MKKFNKGLIMRKGVFINCHTEEQAINLLKWADGEGLRWCDGYRYVDNDYWSVYKNENKCI